MTHEEAKKMGATHYRSGLYQHDLRFYKKENSTWFVLLESEWVRSLHINNECQLKPI